ncbi:MAG TPA: MmcQ/YjbR family DNA-binding protein [Rudaea sp.]
MNANELQTLCGPWPGVASGIKWEDDLVFTVASKMFAVLCLRGPDRDRLSFKVETQRFLELTDQPGIVPAHYMARAFWITLTEPERFARERVEAFVRRSYELVRANLSKKQQGVLIAQEAPVATPVARPARARKR